METPADSASPGGPIRRGPPAATLLRAALLALGATLFAITASDLAWLTVERLGRVGLDPGGIGLAAALLVEAGLLARAGARAVARGGWRTRIARLTGVLWGCVLVNGVLLAWQIVNQT